MKVLIVTNMAPFIWGGAEDLAVHLQKNLIIAGHEAETLRIPFQWDPSTRIPSQMLLARSLELWNVDHVIALKFPAYLIRHPNKTFWLIHQFRQAYDLFDANQSNIPRNQYGDHLRSLIHEADVKSFNEAKHVYTISKITQERLLKYNNIKSTVLPQPINDPELFPGGDNGGYIFAAGRINGMKRQSLLLKAMRYTDKRVRLVIAGPPDKPDDEIELRILIEKYKLSDRVHLDLGYLERSTYAKYVNSSAAVAYIPYDEDSLSYVAMEAATAAKPIVTTSDSGGILGLVTDNKTGWVAEPAELDLAKKMSAVYNSHQNTGDMGKNIRDQLKNMNLNWPNTVDALLK